MRLLLSGGGTAGHIYPALTVAGRLIAEGHEVTFVGTPEGLEARLAGEAGVPFVGVPARGFDRGAPFSLATAAIVSVGSAFRSLRLLARFRPDVVVGFGGYVSLPVGLAAVLRRTPLVLHEQNSVPGLANRVLSRWAVSVGVTYEASIRHLRHPERATLTGNPVRSTVLSADRARGRTSLGVPADATMVLVFGGSRGARHVNEAMIELAPQLLEIPSLHVVHVAGRIEAASVRERLAGRLGSEEARYAVVEYIEAMGDAIAAADLVVARAGATSIAEITAIGRASVLIPYPYATDDHQTLNARTVSQAGAAEVIADAELDGPLLMQAIRRLADAPSRRDKMARAAAGLARRDATQRVIALVEGARAIRKEPR